MNVIQARRALLAAGVVAAIAAASGILSAQAPEDSNVSAMLGLLKPNQFVMAPVAGGGCVVQVFTPAQADRIKSGLGNDSEQNQGQRTLLGSPAAMYYGTIAEVNSDHIKIVSLQRTVRYIATRAVHEIALHED